MATLDGPPIRRRHGEPGPGDQLTLDEFFDRQAVGIRTAAGFVTLTKRQLIRAWCEQLGGAHEDWAVEESLANAVNMQLPIAELRPTVMELQNCTDTALAHGWKVLELARQSNP
ncbi:MAG: hypothetical protein EPO25_17270 [Gammaproteobacteria bacterium]|nr:MAG: hypothetical protein EPO25_17270 [Gammaproteobacteria bacterium]